VSIAGIVVAVILWKVIPTFAAMFEGLGAQLPLPTRIVIQMSNWFVRILPFLVLILVGGGFLIRRYYATYGGRRAIDRMVLKLPILGLIMQKIAVARFCRTLATLISSGVPILDGLEITANTAGNVIVQDAIMQARASIREGDTISNPLRQSKVFPPMVVQMITVGEETGALEEMLTKIADFYDSEVDTAVDALTSIIEPVMIVVMGAIVGAMVVAMYLPIFQMVNVIAG
jgi:type IV pilus assembly protein PilC